MVEKKQNKNRKKPLQASEKRQIERKYMSLPELLNQNYVAQLDNLAKMQTIINESFQNHPVYQEYHRRKQLKKQYNELHKQHKLTIKQVTDFYKILKKQHKQWLILNTRVAILITIAEKLGTLLGTITGKVTNYKNKIKKYFKRSF